MKNFMNYDFNITKIVTACYVPVGTGMRVHKNRPSHGLAFHLTGDKNYVFFDGKSFNVKINDIIYLPKYSNYEVISKVRGDCYAINFDLDEDIDLPPFVIHIKNHNVIEEYYRKARRVWDLKTDGYLFKCKAELYNILYALKQEYSANYIPTEKHNIITPAVNYIHQNYLNNTPSIYYLSNMCNITPEYFRKIFKSLYGTSPLKYINNLKISRARELIESQMYSVTEAAMMSGYTDMSYFSREFKKATGICPSKYV